MKIHEVAAPKQIEINREIAPIKPSAQGISSSSTISSEKNIQGLELFAKSSLALTLGIIPFSIAYVGKTLLNAFTTCGSKSNRLFRYFLGLPAFISALLFAGGSILFSLTQKIAWGTELVKHPQEEKANTIMARYGAGSQPLQDLKGVFRTFFLGKE